ncbi:MAG: formyltransferase family protein [Nannocystaceae bacterium]
MNLDRVVFLAAYTRRSRAYAHAMVARDFRPEHVILFGAEAQRDTRLEGICATGGWTTERLGVPDVNAAEIRDRVAELDPSFVIFSGYGGQILRDGLIAFGTRFLHVHSGWLPQYRGSTTLYYSLLRESRCAASALLLDRNIDTGPIVARKHYPAPASSTEVDHGYDGEIRADLLVDVLEHYVREGDLPQANEQRPEVGTTYYVIHPVLKHLAMLSLAQNRSA